jgi:hypothetical protein
MATGGFNVLPESNSHRRKGQIKVGGRTLNSPRVSPTLPAAGTNQLTSHMAKLMIRDTATCQENYRRFIQRAAAAGEVWMLSDEDGTATCESDEFEETDVILFFSDLPYARRVQTQSFSDHAPERLDLFDLLYRWLPGMTEDGVLAGPNWTGDLVGLEIEPYDLRVELEKHLSAEQQASFATRYRRETGQA